MQPGAQKKLRGLRRSPENRLPVRVRCYLRDDVGVTVDVPQITAELLPCQSGKTGQTSGHRTPPPPSKFKRKNRIGVALWAICPILCDWFI
jgi:hypothetical protein